jgi:hypothetical protein
MLEVANLMVLKGDPEPGGMAVLQFRGGPNMQ